VPRTSRSPPPSPLRAGGLAAEIVAKRATGGLLHSPERVAMMQRVLELDESYFYGGAHLFFATIYSSRPKMLGGDIEKSRQHFERCFEFAQEKFLLPYVYYARYYATRTFDAELFISTLNKIIATPDDILPEQRLPNAIAKQKASILLKKSEEFF
jgi:hypothetical protein